MEIRRSALVPTSSLPLLRNADTNRAGRRYRVPEGVADSVSAARITQQPSLVGQVSDIQIHTRRGVIESCMQTPLPIGRQFEADSIQLTAAIPVIGAGEYVRAVAQRPG